MYWGNPNNDANGCQFDRWDRESACLGSGGSVPIQILYTDS